MRTRKIVALYAVGILLAHSPSNAAVPTSITVQGKLTDAAGVPLAAGPKSFVFRIFDAEFGGTEIWPGGAGEMQTITSSSDGLWVGLVGAINPLSDDLFAGDSRWLQIAVDGTTLPRVKLATNPYAFRIANDAVGSDEIAAGAVGSSEIATGAVGSSEITTDAVHQSEIASGAVGQDELAGNSVGTLQVLDGGLAAFDLFDEPGVASNGASSTIDLDGTTQTLLSRTITCPYVGYVLVIGTVQVGLQHAENFDTRCSFGVSTTAGSLPTNGSLLVTIPASALTGTYSQAVTVQGLFSTAGGQDTFYLIGRETTGIVTVNDRQLSLIYFPTAYGTITEPTTAGAGEYEREEP